MSQIFDHYLHTETSNKTEFESLPIPTQVMMKQLVYHIRDEITIYSGLIGLEQGKYQHDISAKSQHQQLVILCTLNLIKRKGESGVVNRLKHDLCVGLYAFYCSRVLGFGKIPQGVLWTQARINQIVEEAKKMAHFG